ncbi:hypothetical protein SADUNF_Sadunf16G0146600 [Salix dunnii]|uniref:Myb-like domain-containing protein n=1 Tax=Salix dunnii TaxID=1413687 RepID=A0A835MQA8_9ROSI|nr:hypothetical protein SADUNF_Sadunf16G0146600 [Salix dunnii]
MKSGVVASVVEASPGPKALKMRKPEATGKSNDKSNKFKKGLWSPEEDDKLMNYILNNGQGCWSESSNPSPNTSDSSSEPSKEVMGAFMTMQEQGINLPMNMDPSPSSLATSMQEMILNTIMDPLLPTLDHDHGLNMYIGGASGYESNGAPPCMIQGGMNSSDQGLYGLEGIFGGVNVGGPPLESVSCMEENSRSQHIQDNNTDKHPYSSYVNSLNKNCNSSTTDHNKTDNSAAEMGNFWHGEELKVGEWDLEELMKDVSAYPFS